MIAADSSVVVAALLDWHEAHEASRQAAQGAVIPAHALAETYSVLTRLPLPLAPADAARLLAAAFDDARVISPSRRVHLELPATCAAAEIAGGGVYDALIALTAVEHGATLLSRDQRAARIYERVGAQVAWV